ncbi:MAG: strawberry notch-like NTP hydrolase domain-containing protein [Pyrinomonadaceae bacterium]
MSTELNGSLPDSQQVVGAGAAGALGQQPLAAPDAEDSPALLPQTREFVNVVKARLRAGTHFNNPAITALANEVLGGSRMQGTFTPKYVYDCVEVAVNELLLEQEAHALMGMADPALGLDHVLRPLLAQLPTQTDRTQEQQLLQQFSTPPTLAFIAARVLNPRPGDLVMDSSAGTGSLIVWAKAAGAEVLTNEISPRRTALLELMGLPTTNFDAEFLDDLYPPEVVPTAFLINPPFSATGGRVARNSSEFGARHIETSLRRMALGGRLTAVMGEGIRLDKPAFSQWWRRIAAAYTVRAVVGIDGRNYAKYGTTFDNCLLVIDKTGPTPGATWDAQLGSITWGNVETLEEAWAMLAGVAKDRPRVGEVRTRALKAAPAAPAAEEPEAPARATSDVTATAAAPPAAVETLPRQSPQQPVEADAGTDTGEPQIIGAAHADEKAEGAEGDEDIFVPYKPALLRGGVEHPALIVESRSMGSVYPPPITYRPNLPRRILRRGILSALQLERVCYAGQAHEQRLPDGARGGFFVGDGTGVGKGRILAGIIVDNWFQGYDRAVWLSVNNDLMDSTRRDLNDLGVRVPLHKINDFDVKQPITATCGVIFSSYSSLIASAKSGETRLQQLMEWLGPNGVIILDEAHKAKNALAGGRGEPTQTGQAVIDLQNAEKNPDYRVVYSSATGATDVRHMSYMTRLGLWGEGTSFPGGFGEFMCEIDSGGVGAMEMVCRDLKALGKYASASISFGVDPASGLAVEYREIVHRLTDEQRAMYDAMAGAWQIIFQNIDKALEITNGDNRARANAMQKFWGDHQRCCRSVISAFKVPALIAEVEKELASGHACIVSLIGTGESKTKEQIAKQTAGGGHIEDLDFSPREMICGMVDRGFPTTQYVEKTDPSTQQTIRVPLLDGEGKAVESKEALRLKQMLLDQLSRLELPEHPLDQIVNYFGVKAVAELTGRKRRLIRQPDGRLEYVKRNPEGVAMTNANLHEMALFQAGKKDIAIISDAASTGISLHADRRAGNQKRRVHITLELNWSADKQLQTFGRSHRSNQAQPPIYVLLSTELGGEKRFSSTIAKRLASLGALTKGDRGAADGGDLTKYNFETDEGAAALNLLYGNILRGVNVVGLDSPRQTLRNMGLLVRRADGGEEVKKENLHNVPRFLNRVLALGVDEQNSMFNYFVELFEQTIRFAKANGTFDEGVQDIKATAIRLGTTPRVVHQDTLTGAKTTHYKLEVDQPTHPVSFGEAKETPRGTFYRQKRSGHYVLAVESGNHTDPSSGASYRTFALTKPEAARAYYVKESELLEKYQPVQANDVRWWWQSRFEQVPEVVTVEVHIIGGAILPLWQHLKTEEGSSLRVVRVTTDDGMRIVGIQIPKNKLSRVLRALGISRSFKEPAQIFTGVLEEGEEISLVGGLRLRKSFVHQEEAVELICGDPYKYEELRELGLINESIAYKQRFFIPTDSLKGLPVLEAVLKRYPAISTEEEMKETTAEDLERLLSERLGDVDQADQVVDLEELLLVPEGYEGDEEPETQAAPGETDLFSAAAEIPPTQSTLTLVSGSFDFDTTSEPAVEEEEESETSLDITPTPAVAPQPQPQAQAPLFAAAPPAKEATPAKGRKKAKPDDGRQGLLWAA